MTETKKEKKVKKEGFFKTALKSIKDFDKYEDFGIEGLEKTILYLVKITIVLSLVVTLITLYKFSNSLNNGINYFNENIKSLKYEEGTLEINENEKFEAVSENNIKGKLIIDTSELNEEQVNKYKEDIKNEANGIVLLKDRLMLKNEMLSVVTESSYGDFFTKYNITSMDKQGVLDYFENNKFQIYFSMFLALFIYSFAIYVSSIIVDALMLGVLGYITARILGMKIRFGATLSMGVHALTLPIVLNIIYVVINGFTGFTIKYFQFMYTAISYIYIITAIMIIKSEYIKRKLELEKIKSVQEQIREELQAQEQKEEEEKQKQNEEQEKKKQKEKEEKTRNRKPKKTDVGDKPEGSNA